MSQPGNTSDKSEVPPENTKGEQPEKRAPLSLSDLMSIKSASDKAVRANLKEFHDIIQDPGQEVSPKSRFDARKPPI